MLIAKLELEQFFETQHKDDVLYRCAQYLLKHSRDLNTKYEGRFPKDVIPISHRKVELDILDLIDEPVIKPVFQGHDVVSAVDGFVYPNRVLFVTGYGKRKPSRRAVIQEDVLLMMRRCKKLKCIPTLLYWFGQPASDGKRYYVEVALHEILDIEMQAHRTTSKNKVWFTLPDRKIPFKSDQKL